MFKLALRCLPPLLAALTPVLPLPVQAEQAPLTVPLIIDGTIGQDPCAKRGRVVDVDKAPERSLAVLSGPGETFREVGRLPDGEPVMICEKIGAWLGVIHGSATLGCRTTILLPTRQEYTGPCGHGWVPARNVKVEEGEERAGRSPE